MTKNDLLSTLYAINPSSLSYGDWLRVGMALKNEGCCAADWDEWSRLDDERYHPGECEAKWDTFDGSDNPVTGATIVMLAKDAGYTVQISNSGGLPDFLPRRSHAGT